jgi:hypothetical protein
MGLQNVPQYLFCVGTDSLRSRGANERSLGDTRRATRPDYDPLRPDFIEVAGGFPALTGGAGGGAGGWSFVGSGTEWGCGPFLFFEKSGISFFLFILVSVQEE